MMDYENDCPYCGNDCPYCDEEYLALDAPWECQIDQSEAIAEALAATQSLTAEIYAIMEYEDPDYPSGHCR